MNVVNGKQIRDDIKTLLKKAVEKLDHTPTLTLIYAGNDSVIETFIRIKRAFADDIGVGLEVERYPEMVDQGTLSQKMREIGEIGSVDGVVVQLPLPPEIDRSLVLNSIPGDQDPDVLSDEAYERFMRGESPVKPPVVGAVEEIFTRYDIELEGKHVVVIGKGRLVGRPVADWLQLQGIQPVVLDEYDELDDYAPAADILISGAGDRHIITPSLVKEGVVLIDAGTSNSEGGVAGDIHPDCKEKAQLFSPVPGGVGPITVAKLFENLIKLLT